MPAACLPRVGKDMTAIHSTFRRPYRGEGRPIKYNRDDETWDRLAEAGLRFLIERAQLRKITSYTELNAALTGRTALRGFDFDRADERAAMGHLLGLIVERNLPT